MVNTNVVVAGISSFRDQYIAGRIPSADLLHCWAEEEHFVWLSSEDILAEYKEVLKRLHVRSAAIGARINFIPEWPKEYGGFQVDQAGRLKELEFDNDRLKRPVAEMSLDKLVSEDLASFFTQHFSEWSRLTFRSAGPLF